MLQWLSLPLITSCRFDLAPTGALCYSEHVSDAWVKEVLISLPQERCATIVHHTKHRVRPF